MKKCCVLLFASRANMKDLRQPLNSRRRSFTMLYLIPIRRADLTPPPSAPYRGPYTAPPSASS